MDKVIPLKNLVSENKKLANAYILGQMQVHIRSVKSSLYQTALMKGSSDGIRSPTQQDSQILFDAQGYVQTL